MPGENQRVGMAEILRRKMIENESLAQQAAQQLNQKGTAQPGSLDKMLNVGVSKSQSAASHPTTLKEAIAVVFSMAEKEKISVPDAVKVFIQEAQLRVNTQQQPDATAQKTVINQAPQANAQGVDKSGQAGSNNTVAAPHKPT